jgi:glycosyltransferase involved in cell wall biosynthesis
MKMKRVLILEPYYGGSHKLFLQGLQDAVQADYTLFSLPARKWKMRMQLSALWFVEQLKMMPEEERYFDTVLCSTFVDVAVLLALLKSVPGWNRKALITTYFHENQFAYPTQMADVSMYQFTSINFTTALASDRCAFNSSYNMETFLQAIRSYLKKQTDMKLDSCVDEIREKSAVLYPGMDYSFIDQAEKKEHDDGPPVFVWNHRWEHDKGPEEFFEALYLLQRKGLSFRLIVLGESFTNNPECFVKAQKQLSSEIIHFAYAPSKEQYAALLHQGNCVVSTARHEFFGIAVLEGIRAGCYPILPADLSYLELYDKKFLYEPGKLAQRLEKFLLNPVRLGMNEAKSLTQSFAWNECKEKFNKWLFENPWERN